MLPQDSNPSMAIPTRGQLERALTQRLQNLYQERLGQRPQKITCQFFDEKVAIVLENTITLPERLMLDTNRRELAEQLRSELDAAMKPTIQALIQDVIQITVISLLFDTTLDTETSGIIAILAKTPIVRDPDSIPKVKRSKSSAQRESDPTPDSEP